MIRPAPLFLTLLALAAGSPPAAAGPADDLLKLVPPGANTLLVVDVKAAHASPLGKAEKWAELHGKEFRSGVGPVPGDAELVVVGAEVNLTTMTRQHQVALVRLPNVVNFPEMLAREGGQRDEVADTLAVLSPRNVYFAALPGYLVGAVYPADRQAAARWIRHTRSPGPAALSPYLAGAAAGAGDATVVAAVDLTDALPPSVVRYAVTVSPAVARRKVTLLDALAGTIASTRGLTFTARVTDTITGTIRVDFARDPGLFKAVLPEVFLEVVGQQGVAVPGLESWAVAFDDRSMTLTGPLTAADVRRVVSLFAFPGAAGTGSDVVSVPATKQYLAAAEAVLADLAKQKESPDYARMATWHDKAAAQIENQSRRGVDPVAVQAAADCARRLRALAGSLRGVPLDLKALEAQAYVEMVPGWSGGLSRGLFGQWNVSFPNNLPQIDAQMTSVVTGEKVKRGQVWWQINQIIPEAKKKLGAKHKAVF